MQVCQLRVFPVDIYLSLPVGQIELELDKVSLELQKFVQTIDCDPAHHILETTAIILKILKSLNYIKTVKILEFYLPIFSER